MAGTVISIIQKQRWQLRLRAQLTLIFDVRGLHRPGERKEVTERGDAAGAGGVEKKSGDEEGGGSAREKQMEDGVRKRIVGVLFGPPSCHSSSYNDNRARVTSGGIPALFVCVSKCVCVCV